MATDVARMSYDPARHYTGVATQQGRVTLEAEENEERVILTEERRLELLDIVGPAGTPDGGYALSSPGGFDLEVGAGTMYVGGIRVSLDVPVLYSDQPDWLDHIGDPAYHNPERRRSVREHVVLGLIETDVTATEDPVLREAALGGPDGAARTRILQRIYRAPSKGQDCATALEQDQEQWAEQGLVFDPKTMRLESNARLLVTWDEPPGSSDPCQPAAKGGYLGAENQAIRVQVHAVNDDGTFDVLWGYDNASFLYRVTADDSTNPVLTLDRSPVDNFHRPRAGQAVQVLRSAAELLTTDGTVEGFVASLEGEAADLTAPYDPDTKTVQFPAPLPGAYTNPDGTPQLYLRVWEELLTGNAVGDAITLTGTGLKVTLSLDSGLPPHVGDFWTIGVRPSTPDTVLPARLLRAPQPPDGPRMWACPLAVIGWLDGELQVIDDCRVPYPGDREDCCCTVSVHPGDAGQRGLQAIIDAAVAHRAPHDRANTVTVCLCPGRYELPESLLLDHRHNHLHLEGAGEGVVFAAKPGSEDAFAQGLIELVHADNVRISGIEFQMPQVPAAAIKVRPQERELRSFVAPIRDVYNDLFVSIAIRPVHCAVLEIDHCLFRFTVGSGTMTAEAEQTTGRIVFGIGIFAASECWGMRVEHNRFLHDAPHQAQLTRRRPDPERHQPPQRLEEQGGFVNVQRSSAHILVGLLLAPSLVYRSQRSTMAERLPSGALVRSLLTRGRIRDNEFSGLAAAGILFAELGDLRIENNTVRDSYSGFGILSLRSLAFADLAGKYTVAGSIREEVLSQMGQVFLGAAADPMIIAVSVLARTYPLPDSFIAGGEDHIIAAHMVAESNKVDKVEWMKQFVDQAVEPFVEKRVARSRRSKAGADQPAPPKEATFTAGAARDARTPHELAVQQLHVKLSDYERAAAFEPPSRDFELRVTGNDIECAMPGDGQTGPALLVWETDRSYTASALICGNRLGGVAKAVAVIMLVPDVVADGNIVRNFNGKALSLALISRGQVAVTGNVLFGAPVLPPRPNVPAPLDQWDPLNTIVV
jgi:hypothetical protein